MELWLIIASTFALGVTTAIHPCPFTAHIAISSLLSSWGQRGARKLAIFVCFFIAYVATMMLIAVAVLYGVFAFSSLARFLQHLSQVVLGPALVLVGMFQLGLLPWQRSTWSLQMQYWRQREPSLKVVMTIGLFFALAFCPATAAIYFGVLIPSLLQHGAVMIGISSFAAGVVLPMIIVAAVVSGGVLAFDRDQTQQRHMAKRLSAAAGLVVFVIGIYVTLRDVYGY